MTNQRAGNCKITPLTLQCQLQSIAWLWTLFTRLIVINIVPLMNLLCSCNGTRTHNHLVRKPTLNHLAKLAKWLSCIVGTNLYGVLTVCCYHVTYAFQSESTLYSCLNFKEILPQNRRDIWILNDSNAI